MSGLVNDLISGNFAKREQRIVIPGAPFVLHVPSVSETEAKCTYHQLR